MLAPINLEGILSNSNVLRVDSARWQAAQEFELQFAEQSAPAGDDYNLWWREAFNRYEVLQGRRLPDVLEVGCGPHTNIRLILPCISFERLWLEDPLIHAYLKLKREQRVWRYFRFRRPLAVADLVHRYHATPLSEKLEDLLLPDKSIDLCVCINVLDHVQDAQQCIMQMRRVLKDQGILVIGQDLSNEEDVQLCPESWTDIGHPIKMDADFLDSYLGDLMPLYRKILPREDGRNPRCHYGTYLLIGQQSIPQD
jgi:SAM-dependent methyltransferase